MEGHKIRLVFLTGICLLLLGAVSCKSDLSTSPNFSEDEVNAAALSVIALLNEGDYDRLYDMGDAVFQTLPVSDLEAGARFYVDPAGAFERIRIMETAEKESVKADTVYAVVVVCAEYEAGKIQYIITFDQDLRLAGLQISGVNLSLDT